MHVPLNHVFRLKPVTVRHEKGAWYYSFEEHPTNWGRKYSSLQACLQGASRKLAEQWMERANRIERPAKPAKVRRAA